MILKKADEPDRVRRLGRAALAAGQRGEALTRRLAAFSDGHDGPPAQRIDLGALVRAAEGILRTAAGPTADLMIETPSEPLEARIDPVALDAALAALVTNAAQATGGQGSVAVRLALAEGGGAVISVRDDGAGMTDDVARLAMEPFFTTREGAAGLGLAQVHAFARQSGGALSIDSAPERGTEVTLTLPSPD
jgi:signal transduction histidine kinase